MLELTTPRLQETFLDLVTELQPEAVLEMGAKEAEFSRACRRRLPDAEIHAFEANPLIYARHREAIEAEGVRLHHMAVAETSGPIRFLISTEIEGRPISPKSGGHSLKSRNGRVAVREEAVQGTSVDDFCAAQGLIGRPCAMWIDLEGCAYEALMGAGRMLASTLAILVEVETKAIWTGQRLAGEVDGLLRQRGFEAVAKDQEFPRQYNVVYRRAG